MASGSYFTGLTAQPKLYENIYYQKQAKSDAAEAARQKEQSDKYAKDADKFRIDYSKIHRIYAPKAKGAVAEFMSTADELKQKYPHTYSNTEEYNNAYFKATSELEDLQNYSKNIYGALEMRAKDVKDEFQTNPELVKALAGGSLQDVQGLLGRENVELDDVLQKRFNEVEHQKFLNDAVGRAKLIDETSIKALGKGTNDYLITETDVIDKDNLKQVAQTAYNNDPAAQRDFTFDEYLKKAETWVAPKSQQLLRSLQTVAADTKGFKSTGAGQLANTKVSATYTQPKSGEEIIGFDWVASEGKPATRPFYIAEKTASGKEIGEVEAYPTAFIKRGKDIKVQLKYQTPAGTLKTVEVGYYDPVTKGSSETVKTVLARNYGLEFMKTLQEMDLLDKTIEERASFVGKAGSNAEQKTETVKAPNIQGKAYVDKSGNKVKDIDKLTPAQLKQLVDAGLILEQ